jgi:Flp pilus assembly protein TadG
MRDRAGNIAFTFALLAMPVIIGLGVSVDYVRAYNVRVRMQSDLDAALIAAVKKVDGLDEDHIKEEVTKWFAAQADSGEATYDVDTDTITVNKSNRTIQAVAAGVVPTTLMGIVNVDSINVKVATSVAGPSTSYLNVYIVLDKSASMLLAATAAGQTAMRNSPAGCVFACHTVEGGPWTYQGNSYTTNYLLAEAMGVKLRTDVALDAAEEVLSMIEAADPTHSRIKVGLYSIGSTATQVLAPTSSTSTALTTLRDNSKGLTSTTSQTTTRFDTSMTSLTTLVGSAGDGSSASAPLKLILILTDGVQSERPWVVANDNTPKYVTPLNPNWCGTMKTNGATVGVLYTEYLPMTWDWGYNRTLDKTMASSSYASKWGGSLVAGISSSVKRHDYIPTALKTCATSEDLYLSAASPSEIEAGLSTLFQQYLGSVRLTQ